MPIQLRPYQRKIVEDLRASLASNDATLAIALMGLGKTAISGYIMAQARKKGRRSVFVVPYDVLVQQSINAFHEGFGLSCGVLQGSHWPRSCHDIVVASQATLAKRLDEGYDLAELMAGEVHLGIFDEAHLSAFCSAYDPVRDRLRQNKGRIIGLTATPWRTQIRKEWLGQKFSDLVVGPMPSDAIRGGYVVPCTAYASKGALDVSKLTIGADGDYKARGITAQAILPKSLEVVVGEWRRLASDRPTLMVGASVKQAIATANAFNEAGIPAKVILGSTSHKQRQAIFRETIDGDNKIICSVGCLSAGLNIPEISCVLYVRETTSKSLFFQTAGRGSRPRPGKEDFVLLDFGTNLERFGSPMDDPEYSIEDPNVYYPCPACEGPVPKGSAKCPHCGHRMKEEEVLEAEEEARVAKEIERLLPTLDIFVSPQDTPKVKKLRTHRRITFLRGESPDVSLNEFKEAHGYMPRWEWTVGACLGVAPSRDEVSRFASWLSGSYGGEQKHYPGWLNFHWIREFGVPAPHNAAIAQ